MVQAMVAEAEQALVTEAEFQALQALIPALPAPAVTPPTMLDPKGKSSIDIHSHPYADVEDRRQEVFLFVA